MNNWDYFDKVPVYHPIADANNLYDGFYKARKGSHWKGQVQKYRWNVLSETRKLQKELDNFEKRKPNAYKLSQYSFFFVNERGKVRAITALGIRDRVVKHVLNDLYLLPHIRPHLIYDNGASLTGRGVSFSRKRLVAHLEAFYREHQSNEGYIVLVDFSGYYDNIDHYEPIKMIMKYEPDDFARRLTWQAYISYKIDVSYMNDNEFQAMEHTKFSTVNYRLERHTKNELRGEKYLHRSLSVGDQTSQITAISFPTPIDNLVKIVNQQKYYGRYMDDFYIIVKTAEEAHRILDQIYEKANEMKLFVNPKKTMIVKLKRSFKFMQFKYYIADNGHVVIRINPKTITRMKRKLKKLYTLYKTGNVRFQKIESLFQSWIANYKKYMSNIQLTNIIRLYQNLYGGGLDKWMRRRFIISDSQMVAA